MMLLVPKNRDGKKIKYAGEVYANLGTPIPIQNINQANWKVTSNHDDEWEADPENKEKSILKRRGGTTLLESRTHKLPGINDPQVTLEIVWEYTYNPSINNYDLSAELGEKCTHRIIDTTGNIVARVDPMVYAALMNAIGSRHQLLTPPPKRKQETNQIKRADEMDKPEYIEIDGHKYRLANQQRPVEAKRKRLSRKKIADDVAQTFHDDFFRGDGVKFYIDALLVSKTGSNLPSLAKSAKTIPADIYEDLNPEQQVAAKKAAKSGTLWKVQLGDDGEGWMWAGDKPSTKQVSAIQEVLTFLKKQKAKHESSGRSAVLYAYCSNKWIGR